MPSRTKSSTATCLAREAAAGSRAPGEPPYRFTVEIQVHTLESYLRTICTTHDANHVALKLRQFLGGLVPYLFPAAIFGRDWLRLDPAPTRE